MAGETDMSESNPLPADNDVSVEATQGSDSANLNTIEAESVTIINAAQVQSIDIATRFRRLATVDGWVLTLLQPSRVIVNLSTSMRKIEMPLAEGDQVIKEREDLLILRKHPADRYKTHRAASSLAKSREDLLGATSEEV
jgi:hypothetical protein